MTLPNIPFVSTAKPEPTAQDVANDALDLFTQAKIKLQQSSVMANNLIEENNEVIRAKQEQNNTLTALTTKNSKVIENLTNLVGE